MGSGTMQHVLYALPPRPFFSGTRCSPPVYEARTGFTPQRPRYASPPLLATPPRLLTSALSNSKRSRAAVKQRAITRCPLALGWSLCRVGAHTSQSQPQAAPTGPKVLGFATSISHGSSGRGVACERSTPCYRRCASATAARDSSGQATHASGISSRRTPAFSEPGGATNSSRP